MNFWLAFEVIFAFGFMIAIHEFGHFLACRFFGIRVERFAIGFGPTLWSKKIGDTEYALQSVPLGGYCKPAGGDLSGESAEKMYEKPAEPGEFLWVSWWKRALVFLAGPTMNYLSAVVLIAAALMIGDRIPVENPILGYVPPKSLAASCGLKADDTIEKVDGKAVTAFSDLEPLYDKFSTEKDSTALLMVHRGDKSFPVTFSGRLEKVNPSLGLFPKTPPVIGSVALMTPARKAGVEEGDKVLSVNGTSVSEWHELAFLIRGANTDAVTLQLERKGQMFPVSLLRVDNGLYKAIGISPTDSGHYEFKRLGFVDAWQASFRVTINMSGSFITSLGKLVTGRISLKDNIAGPVTIVRTMYQKATQGGVEFMNTVAFISLILCLMNLLPIPVVDGGQIVLCGLEGIRRKPMSIKFQLTYQQIGFFFVVALMVLAVFNDCWGLIMELKNHHP
jgi:regulator of sigma E protease